MAREKELFRDNLVRLDAAFPGVELLPIVKVAAYLGKDKRTLKAQKGFPARKVGGYWVVPKAALASWLS